MRIEGWVSGLVAALFLSSPLVAAADPPLPGREPLRQVDRPLTHVQGTLNLYAGFDTFVLSANIGGRISQGSTATHLHVGAEVGVLDDLTLGALILPVDLSPEAQYGNPALYATFRFVRGTVEVGASVDLTLPTLRGSDPSLDLGIPVRIHAGRYVRLDTGAYVDIEMAAVASAAIVVPFGVSINPIERLLLGATTGLVIPTDHADFVTIPLGFGVGYTVGERDMPFADLWLRWQMPFFLTPGLNDVTHPDIWQLGFLADVYFDLDF